MQYFIQLANKRKMLHINYIKLLKCCLTYLRRFKTFFTYNYKTGTDEYPLSNCKKKCPFILKLAIQQKMDLSL